MNGPATKNGPLFIKNDHLNTTRFASRLAADNKYIIVSEHEQQREGGQDNDGLRNYNSKISFKFPQIRIIFKINSPPFPLAFAVFKPLSQKHRQLLAQIIQLIGLAKQQTMSLAEVHRLLVSTRVSRIFMRSLAH